MSINRDALKYVIEYTREALSVAWALSADAGTSQSSRNQYTFNAVNLLAQELDKHDWDVKKYLEFKVDLDEFNPDERPNPKEENLRDEINEMYEDLNVVFDKKLELT